MDQTNNPSTSTSSEQQDIAIIGMSCRFPNAANYREFWRNLVTRRDCIQEIPANRWNWQDYYGDPQTEINKSNSKWGGFFTDFDRFDPTFFGISPREVRTMDPQQRMALELTWECIEDAGIEPASLAGKNIGIYLGSCNYDYKERQEKYIEVVEGHTPTGTANAILPGRISYFFNFQGPSLTIDTACSSSLVCIHEAVQSIRRGECESALAGGVNLLCTPTRYISFGQLGMLSPDGRCKTFDESANGYVRGEGGGLVFLKSLKQARKDNDPILAIVKGSAVNHGGRARSITAPNAISQAKVIQAALQDAGVSPQHINYVEAHGTGTPLGDPIEILGLKRAFRSQQDESGNESGYCAVGAVKSNIGHLESAAGVAGLIKIILAMRHKQLPPNLHFSQLNPRIELNQSPFYILDKQQDWKPLLDKDGQSLPLRAGVSSFGFSGVNSHVILEQAPAAKPQPQPEQPVLLLSAHSDRALKLLAQSYLTLLEDDHQSLNRLCARASKRQPMAFRWAAPATDRQDLMLALRSLLEQKQEIAPTTEQSLAFLFTGQGAQFADMGLSLLEQQPVFRRTMQECDRLAQPYLHQSLLEVIYGEQQQLLNLTQYTQPALFAFEYSLACMWQALGIKPNIMLGHSVGELAAACFAQVFTLEEGIRLICQRGRLMADLPSDGAMLSVSMGEQALKDWLQQHSLTLDIAVINGPSACVLSGSRDQIEQTNRLLHAAKQQTTLLPVSQAFHSRLMDPILTTFLATASKVQFKPPQIPIISNLTGQVESELLTKPEYWVRHLRESVNFQAGVETLLQDDSSVWLEIGPSRTLCHLASQIAKEQSVSTLPVCITSLDKVNNVPALSPLCRLFQAGCWLDRSACFPNPVEPEVTLPDYPFDRHSFWIDETEVSTPLPSGDYGTCLHTTTGDLNLICQETLVPDQMGDYLLDHCLFDTSVLPASAYLSLALAAFSRVRGEQLQWPVRLYDFELLQPLELSQPTRLQTLLTQKNNADKQTWQLVLQGYAEQNQSWEVFAQGKLTEGVEGSLANFPLPSDDRVAVDREQFYADAADLGLRYGPHFQAVHSIGLHQNCVSANVQLQSQTKDLPPHLTSLHPVLLDAGLQTMSLSLDQKTKAKRLIPVPQQIGELVWYRPATGSLNVCSQLTRSANESTQLNGQLTFTDAEGQLIASLSQIHIGLMSPSHLASQQHPHSGPRFRLSWSESRESLTNSVNTEQNCLLLYARQGVHLKDAFVAAFPSESCQTLSFEEAQQPGQIEAKITNHAIQSVYFLVSPIDELADGGELVGSQLSCLLQQLKELYRQTEKSFGETSTLQVRLISEQAFAVKDEEQRSGLSAACAGLFASAIAEYSHWQGAIVDLSGAQTVDQLIANLRLGRRAMTTNGPVRKAHLIAIRDGQIFHPHWRPTSTTPETGSPYRRGGVYLITGGSKGIGLALAKDLLKKQQARLVLIGRTPLNSALQTTLTELRQLGGEVLYHQGDVADAATAEQAVAHAIEQFGTINGVFHCAGAIKDKRLNDLQTQDLQAVLAPKVAGAINLYRSVADRSLDFLAYFSSITTQLCPAGQANYVAANSFVDAFAHNLNQKAAFPVRVVNWGHWGETGMAASKDFHQRFAAQGIFPLSNEEGLNILADCLRTSNVQTLALKADDHFLSHWLTPAQASIGTNNKPTLPTFEELQLANDSEAKSALLKGLREILLHTLQVDDHYLPSQENSLLELNLTALGMDSLTAVDIRKRVKEWLGVELSSELLLGGSRLLNVIDDIRSKLLMQQLSQSKETQDDTDMEVFEL